MILKGSQRANGADLATHLMQAVDNEVVEIAQTYGTVAADLHGAFAKMEATAAGTNAKNYLYSLSINPSAALTRDQYFEAIAVIENGLGLKGQPRAVVFHVKDGREHCHVVWSKIDAANMKAIHMAYDHAILCDLSCRLARKYGLDLPPGLIAWEQNRAFEKPYLEASMAENAIAKETGITPDEREADITAAYNSADSPGAFQSALIEGGYILARGDKRRYVVVDSFAKVHSLTRYIKGHTARSINRRLQAALAFADLPSVDEAKESVRQHRQAAEDAGQVHLAARVERARAQAIAALKARQKQRRIPLYGKEQDLLIRHAAERMALHAAQAREGRGSIATRVKRAVLALILRTPGLRSILAHISGNKDLGLTERHKLEGQALLARHARERALIEREKRSMAAVETRERKALEQKLRRKATQRSSQAPTLKTDSRHEDESVHRLHERLVFEREQLLWDQGLSPIFNRHAAPYEREDDDEALAFELLRAFTHAASDDGEDGEGDKGSADGPEPASEQQSARTRKRKDEDSDRKRGRKRRRRRDPDRKR
jgi:hypothetical protein